MPWYRLAALATMARWPNAVLAAAAVVTGAWWAAAGHPPPARTAWMVAAAIALAILANAWNAFEDRRIDAVAHPDRPIPRGTARPGDAVALTVAAAVGALASSAVLGRGVVVVTLAIIALMLGYGSLKARSGLAANVVAAGLASLPFLYGAWAADAPSRGLVLVAIAWPLHMAREIAKDLDDAAADAPFRRTLPHVAGPAWCRGLVVVMTALALGAFLALAVGGRGRIAAWGVLPAAVACAYAAWCTVRGRTGGPAWYKAGMACAVVGLLAAAARAA